VVAPRVALARARGSLVNGVAIALVLAVLIALIAGVHIGYCVGVLHGARRAARGDSSAQPRPAKSATRFATAPGRCGDWPRGDRIGAAQTRESKGS
jgi:hypothetical protein